MRILAINSSLRKQPGVNQLLIDHLFEGATRGGASCEVVHLAQHTIRRCSVCEHCQGAADYGCVHGQKDDFEEIVDKIRNADLIVFSTPIYVLQMSSLLKTFFERYYAYGKVGVRSMTRSGLIFHDVDAGLASKPFVSIIVADNVEKETTASTELFFKNFAQFVDAEHRGAVVRNGAFLFSAPGFETVRAAVLDAMVRAGEELATCGRISSRTLKQLRRSPLPMPRFVLQLLKKTARGRKVLLEKANASAAAQAAFAAAPPACPAAVQR